MADYMLVFMLQKILSLSGLLGQHFMLLCHYAEQKRMMDNQLAIFIFFLLCLVSSSAARTLYVHAPSLPLFLVKKHVESFTMDPFGPKYS